MFREMRRKDRSVSVGRAYEILNQADYGVLTIDGDDGYPYGVPVNHILIDDVIYFHAATEGKKFDSIMLNNKVGFTAVAYDEIAAEKLSTTYASVICMGKVFVVEGEEKRKVLIELTKRFASEFIEIGVKSIEKSINRTAILKIEIDHITGKENKR